MENYDTITDALASLRLQGYTIDFNIAFDRGKSNETNKIFDPEDFWITKVFRFEGVTDPEDEAIVYAIESRKEKIRGVMVSAFGTYADPSTNIIIGKLDMHLTQ